MLYSNLTLSLANNLAQNLLKKLGTQSVMSSFGRSQSIKFKRLRNACTHCSVDQVSASLIKVTCFKNLYVTDMIVLKPYFVSGKASIKSSVSVKKSISGDLIGCKDL